jgi:hypothetical protein
VATINRISGNILQDNLVRGANLAVQGNLVFVDVVNTRLGINTATTTHTLTVNGDTNISGNLFVDQVDATGNIATQTAIIAGNAVISSNLGQAVLSGITGAELQYSQASNVSVVSVGDQIAVVQVTDGITQAEITVLPSNVTISGSSGSDTELTVIGNIIVGNIAAFGNLTVGGVDVATDISVAGNIQANNITALISLTANNVTIDNNISVGNTVSSDTVLANSISADTVDSNNITVNNNFTAVGNVSLENLSIANTTIQANIANGNVTLAPTDNQLVIVDTNTGLAIPVGNTDQQPATAIIGTIRFNTDFNSIEVFDGADWDQIGQDVAAINDQTLSGDGITTQFTLIQDTLANAIIVSTNGILQRPGVSYTVSGNILTFAEPPQVADIVDVRFIADVAIVNQITNASGNSIVLDQSGVANASTTHSLQLPSYTVTEASSLSDVESGQIIYCSNGDSGSPCLAVYSVDSWRIVSLGANISS